LIPGGHSSQREKKIPGARANQPRGALRAARYAERATRAGVLRTAQLSTLHIHVPVVSPVMKPRDSLVLHFASYRARGTYSVPHLQTLTRVDGPQDGGRAEPLALPVLLHDTMWPWSKKEDAPQAASAALSEPPAAAAPKAPAASDDVWVDLLKCSLSEAERDALIHTDSEEPCEFARGTVLRDGKGTERRVRLDGSELELSVHADAVAPANPAVQDDLDDVSQLSQLNEATLLHHIASRYLEQQQIYTRAGPVLVAMNPFTRLPELYSDVQLARYQVEEKGGGCGSGVGAAGGI